MNEGNEYYKLRKIDGRLPDYTPEKLLEKWNEYVDWVFKNPLHTINVQKLKVARDQEEIKQVEVPVMRAFTIEGYCNFADIVFQTFRNYEMRGGEYLEVCTRIRQQIENMQFEGAAANLLNPAIIARKLGLADKTIEIKDVATIDEIEVKVSNEATSH